MDADAVIISDRYQFAFIHVPKCAGTSVRRALAEYDDRSGLYTILTGGHPVLGRVDLGHLPLFTLREHFSREFNNIRNYWSFALIRDPYERFGSSLAQRLKLYGDRPLIQLTEQEVEREIEHAIAHLSGIPRGQLLEQEYVHFQPQVDYLFLDGERIVQSVYAVDQLDMLLADVSRRIGSDSPQFTDTVSEMANRSMTYRSDRIRRLVQSARPAIRRLAGYLPERAKDRLREFVYVTRDRSLRRLFQADHVRRFIADYYREDIAFWESERANRAGTARA
jgi:hypothetical protein